MYNSHYWYFNDRFKFQKSLCNGCHNLLTLCLHNSDITIITVKGADYQYKIIGISKSDATNLLENSVLNDREYI